MTIFLKNALILKGNIIYAKSGSELTAVKNGYLVSEAGVITGVFRQLPERYEGAAVRDYGDSLIIPGWSTCTCTRAIYHPQHGDGPGTDSVAESVRLPKKKYADTGMPLRLTALLSALKPALPRAFFCLAARTDDGNPDGYGAIRSGNVWARSI